MDFYQAIVIAIVEGITEYLPISSTGHMIITSSMMGIQKDDFTKLYEVAIQLGAILAAVVLYRDKFFNRQCDRTVMAGRRYNVDHVDLRIGDQIFVALVDSGDAEPARFEPGDFRARRTDGNYFGKTEPANGFSVVGTDEAKAHEATADSLHSAPFDPCPILRV